MITWLYLFIDVSLPSWADARAFWSAATGWRESPTRGENDQFLTLLPDRGDPWVKLQAIDGPPRIHLDLDATERKAPVERSVALGAAHAWRFDDVEVMRSPGGLLFCHTLGVAGRALARGGPRLLDQVCLDIPSAAWDDEIEFWRQLTGRDLVRGSRPEFARLEGPGPRILLQRLDEPDGPVRGHPDFAVADRAAETGRHERLGAEVLDRREHWTVLRAPGGQVYCLTDRDPETGLLRA